MTNAAHICSQMYALLRTSSELMQEVKGDSDEAQEADDRALAEADAIHRGLAAGTGSGGTGTLIASEEAGPLGADAMPMTADEKASSDERRALMALAGQEQRRADAMSLAERQSWVIMTRLLLNIREAAGEEVDPEFEQKQAEREQVRVYGGGSGAVCRFLTLHDYLALLHVH
jgi:hypothetical protein